MLFLRISVIVLILVGVLAGITGLAIGTVHIHVTPIIFGTVGLYILFFLFNSIVRYLKSIEGTEFPDWYNNDGNPSSGNTPPTVDPDSSTGNTFSIAEKKRMLYEQVEKAISKKDKA